MTFRIFAIWLGLFRAATSIFAANDQSASRPARPIPAIEHVCIISVDGLRPDRALIADMPNLRKMLKAGSYTFWARTTPNSITLPSHVSMLTGVSPRRHGVEWNRDLPFSEPVYPTVPTIFELARQAGYTTAMVAGKSKFTIFEKPGALTYSEVSKTGSSNNLSVARAAVQIIEADKPDLLFIHFPEVDAFGHKNGWGSPEQLAAIEETDVRLGEVLAAFEHAGILQSTFIILTADHGGAGRNHGPDDARSRHIPWIATGPGVKPGFDLTQIASLEVNTEDSAATALFLLGVKLPAYLDGKPVVAIFEPKQ